MKQILEINEVKGFSCPKELFEQVKKVNIDFNQENVIIIYFNSRNKYLDSELVHMGGVNSTLIDLRVIFRKALINNAVSIAIAHNHPSGYLEPSDCDEVVYKKLKEAGELIDIKVLDSLIFNETEYYSMGSN
jgi:DNA repair protein RadC